MRKLSDMPNIGKELEACLEKVGIETARELIDTGSCKAFQLLHAVDPGVCINTLYALEGAIQNIRWHTLEKVKKLELHLFFKMLNHSL